jgi:hypothetical protein
VPDFAGDVRCGKYSPLGLVWLWGADFVGGERVFISLGLSGSADEKQQNQCADYREDNKTPYEALRGHFHRGECRIHLK